MKIAIISPWTISESVVGGTERFVIDLANSLKNLNNEIDVYMLQGKKFTKNSINFISLDLWKNGNYIDENVIDKLFGNFQSEDSFIKIAEKLEELINWKKYDLIQLNSLLFLKTFKNSNRIFTIHTNPFEYELAYKKQGFEIMTKIMKEESKVANTIFVAPSKYYANEYSKIIDNKVYNIPHAIDIKRLTSIKNDNIFLEKYNIAKNKKHILLPSRLEPVQKQPMLFMKAFAKFDSETKSNYQIICGGSDEQYSIYKEDIENYCNKNDININILKFDNNEMGEAYNNSDIVVLPSKSESFGYAALESLCLGIPTILNNIPTYMEVTEDAENSFIFNGTEESLYNKLNYVIKNKIKRKKQKDIWYNKYNPELFGKRYLNLLERK